MTTISRLKNKSLDLGFTKIIEDLGFTLSPNGFWFYRKRGEYVDFIGFWISSSENWMDVPVICLKYDLIDHCDKGEFPKGLDKDIPFYSSTFINEEYGVEIGSDSWKIKEESDVEESLSELRDLMGNAMNWFENINTDEKLYMSFTENFRESVKADELKKILCG